MQPSVAEFARDLSSLDLLDPPPIPRRRPTRRQAFVWRSYDRWQSHPGYGLEPETVLNVFRAAELGHLRAQQDLFDDILESDGNLRALYRARIDGVSGKDWIIQPGADDDVSRAAAEALERLIRDDELDFVEFLEHQLEAVFRGYSASEIIWEVRDGLVVPTRFVDVPHRRFRTGERGELLLLTEGNTAGVPLEAGKWVVSRRRHANLARAGLLRTATWFSLFKRMSFRDWVAFAEKFGVPIPIGEYDDTIADTSPTSKARQALETALVDLGDGGAAILEKGTRIYFAEVAARSGDAESVHPAIVDHCDTEIAKLIAGGVLTSDTGGPGSFALGKVHEGSFFALKIADAVLFARTFLRDVAIPFLRYNGFDAAGGRAPRLRLKLIPALDPKTMSAVATLLVEHGAVLDVSQLRDELGFRSPTRPEDAGRIASGQVGSDPDPSEVEA